MNTTPLITAALAAAAFLGGSPGASAQTLEAVQIGSAAGRPTSIAFAPGVTDQFYVAEKGGRIWVMRNGNYLNTPFLDIRSIVNDAGEGGLLGFVFDPDFGTNGHFYLSYTSGTGSGEAFVSRFSVMAGSVNQGDPASEQILFGPLPQNSSIHKAGDIEFGPDGTLYFSLGDGGDASGGEPQMIGSPLGKIHRIDPDLPFPHVPADNPFVGVAGAVETVWAIGFRNPWRFDVDPITGDLFVADVGAGGFEEITRIPGGIGGGNGGWPCLEGNDCVSSSACSCTDPSLIAPIAVLGHGGAADAACSIIGGFVYRGAAISGLAGQYLFTDFCSGRHYRIEDPAGNPSVVNISNFVNNGGAPLGGVVDFARDHEGEVYLAEHFSARLWKLVPRGGFETYCSTASNSSGAPAALTATGSPSVAAGNLMLNVMDLPVQALGYFIIGGTRDEVVGFGGSQGTLCIGVPIARWSNLIQDSGAAGQVSLGTDLTNLPATVNAEPGVTWHFQYWTRDANPGVTSNTSNAVAVTFVP